MERDKEIQELKERLASIENQLHRRPHSSRIINFTIRFIVVVVLTLIAVGVVQFIVSSNG